MKYKIMQVRFSMFYYIFMFVFYLMFDFAAIEYCYSNYITLFENDVYLLLWGFCLFTSFFIGVRALIKFNHNYRQYKKLKERFYEKNEKK